jgi:hypothetical protein
MERPWLECAAVPQATILAKFRAWIVSMVAPQTPTLLYGSLEFRRQGPMAQCLQQAESAPIGQGLIAAARSNAVSTPSIWAFLSIWAVDWQIVQSATSAFGLTMLVFFFSFFMKISSRAFNLIWRRTYQMMDEYEVGAILY